MEKKVTPAEIVIMAAGAVTLIFSFFPFFSISSRFIDDDITAWGDGLFPIATFIALCGTLMALQVALTRLANLELPARIATFTWEQIHLVLGVFATLIAVGYLLVDKGGYDFGFGFWLSLLGAIALLVGAVMLQRERTGAAPGQGGLA